MCFTVIVHDSGVSTTTLVLLAAGMGSETAHGMNTPGDGFGAITEQYRTGMFVILLTGFPELFLPLARRTPCETSF